MSNHTPGPWTIEKSTRTDHHIIAGRRWIATASNHDFHPTQDENERTIANARLIAAAPDLLAALVEIVGQENPNRWGYDAAHKALDDDWRAQARAAIAKATGEVKEDKA